MRRIKKAKEPKVLAQYRATAAATYNGFQTAQRTQILRESLLSDQGGICCYCMQRIYPNEDAMKVEHWRSQRRFPDYQLDYSNMLAACMGNEGEPEEEQHCDTRKGNKDLARNPADPDDRIEDFIQYLGDGTIVSNDPDLNEQLGEDVLNLNRALFISNRLSVLDAFHQSLPGNRTLTKGELRKMEKDWGSGAAGVELKPFCGVVVYWIRKRLARA
jgi:uncharacterized protein (TIGR02646 family)